MPKTSIIVVDPGAAPAALDALSSDPEVDVHLHDLAPGVFLVTTDKGAWDLYQGLVSALGAEAQPFVGMMSGPIVSSRQVPEGLRDARIWFAPAHAH